MILIQSYERIAENKTKQCIIRKCWIRAVSALGMPGFQKRITKMEMLSSLLKALKYREKDKQWFMETLHAECFEEKK